MASRVSGMLLAGGAILGLVLIKTGTPRSEWNLLYLHILLSLGGTGILFAQWTRSHASSGGGAKCWLLTLFALVLVGFGARYVRESQWRNRGRIENAALPPASMDQEGDGPAGPFFPSSAQVYGER